MIHHVSFNARTPERTAAAVAELVGGTALRAPVPPFPADSWLVCRGDDAGTMFEVFPWGAVRDPDARGIGHDPAMRPRTGTHLLVGTPLGADAVAALAAREGWAARPGNAGLFRFTEVWVENAFLLEVMAPDQARDYVAAFGRAGLPTLNATLRRVEAELAGVGAAG